MKTHPVFKLTPLSQWKKVPISDAFDSELNPEFGGLEVLENYECTVFRDGEAQSKANEIRSKTKQPVSKPVRQFNNNFKPNRECELEYQSESQGQTEMESESESDPNAASPVSTTIPLYIIYLILREFIVMIGKKIIFKFMPSTHFK